MGNYKELRTKFPVSRLSPAPEGAERAGRTRIFSGGIGDLAADLLRGIMILQFDFVPLSDIWHVMATNEKELLEGIREQEYKYGFTSDIETETIGKGLSEEVVRLISAKKGEPEWMTERRVAATG